MGMRAIHPRTYSDMDKQNHQPYYHTGPLLSLLLVSVQQAPHTGNSTLTVAGCSSRQPCTCWCDGRVHVCLSVVLQLDLLTAAEAESCIALEFNPVRVGFHGGAGGWQAAADLASCGGM